MNMIECKLFQAFLLASVANFFVINVTDAIIINQSPYKESRKLSNFDSSKTKFGVEENELQKISNSLNIKQPNNYNYKESHLSKVSQDEKKLKNFFNIKSTKNGNRIKRHVHENEHYKRRRCKKIYYPLYYIQHFDCEEDADPNEEPQLIYPGNSFNEYPNYVHPFYLQNTYNYPFEMSDYENENYGDDYEENFCTEDEEFKGNEDDGEYSKKKIPIDEVFKQDPKQSLGKALGGQNRVQVDGSETKETDLLKTFSELSVYEQNYLQQTVIKVLEDYESTLKTRYHITNVNEIFQSSEAKTMIINAIRNLIENKSEEHSFVRISDEIIESALLYVINYSKNNSHSNKKILIPIAEGSFKIGQWIQSNENSDSRRKNKENLLNIETQISPSIKNSETGTEMSLTVNSKAKPVKTKFSIEIENAEVGPSESDMINNYLPTQYYSHESKNLDYRKNNYQNEQYSKMSEQSNYNQNNQNFNMNSQLNKPNQNFLLSTERNTKEQNQFSEALRDKSNSKSESSFHSVSNGNNNGNSQVDSSLKHEENFESERGLNSSENRDFNERTQFRGLLRNKKHSDPKDNESFEKNIYKNPQIVGLLANDQKILTIDKISSPITKENNKNSHLHSSSRRNADSRINVNSFKINENNKFLGLPIGTKNIVNDDNFQDTGIEKIGKIGIDEVDRTNNYFHTENRSKQMIESNLHSSMELKNLNSSEKGKDKSMNGNHSKRRKNSHVLGRLIPQNKENSEFIYKEKLLSLPLKLIKLNDGSFLVTVLNKIRNCSRNIHSSHNRNQSGINKRDSDGKTLEKDESRTNNSSDQEMDTVKPRECSKEADFTISLEEDKKDEQEQYKQYLETLLEVNDIPTNDRSIIITDVMGKKMFNNEESNLNNKSDKNEKNGSKNKLIIEKITAKPNKQNRNTINCQESDTCSINTGFDILRVLLNWLQDLILTTLNKKQNY